MTTERLDGVVRRLVRLPDRTLELAMGEMLQNLLVAHAVLDGVRRSEARLLIPQIAEDGSLIKGALIDSRWAVWVRESDSNYTALYSALLAVVAEWRRRHDGLAPRCYDRVQALALLPANMPIGGLTPVPEAPLPRMRSYNSQI